MASVNTSVIKRPRPDGSGLIGVTTDQLVIKRVRIVSEVPNSTVDRTQLLQDADGEIALTSQIPNSSSFVTLTGNQVINGVKTFSMNPTITAITSPSGYVLTIPDTTNDTIAKLGDISGGGFVTLTGTQSITGFKTFSTNPKIAAIISPTGYTLTLPDSVNGTVALTSQIPTNSTYVDLTTNQSVAGNKTFSSDLTISSGNLTLTNGRLLSTALGTNSAPAIAIGTSSNDGIYSPSATQLCLVTNGTARITLSTASVTLNANLALTGSGTTTFTSGSGGFTSAGPVISTLASSATTCAFRPSSSANTGLFGSSSTVGVAVSGSQIASFTSTGPSFTGITSSSTSIVTPLIRPVSGTSIIMAPAVDSASGTHTLQVSPTSGAWAAGGVANLYLGDFNHYITCSYSNPMVINDSNGIKIGSNGVTMYNIQRGSVAYSTPLSSQSYASTSISFSNTFSTVPGQVLVTLNMTAGSTYWDQCSCQVASTSTTGFTLGIRNNNPTNATTGTVNISFIAIQ